MSTPYIGSKISLISKSDVRYEGVLYSIDTKESKVYLQNVRCFGTDDRRPDNRIPASDEIYPFIIFRGSDIKDLFVCEAPKPQAPLPDEAIISQSPMGGGFPPQPYPMQPYGMQGYQPGYQPYGQPGMYQQHPQQGLPGQQHPQPQPQQQQPSHQQQPQQQQAPQNAQPQVEGAQPTGPPQRDAVDSISSQAPLQFGNPALSAQGSTQQSVANHEERGDEQSRSQSAQNRNVNPSGRRYDSRNRNYGSNETQQDRFAEEFDFEASNTKLDKEKLAQEFQEVKGDVAEVAITSSTDDDKPISKQVYDKESSFFDTISCEALERAGMDHKPRRTPEEYEQQRKQDIETFGQANYDQRRRYRGGYRGRGRGRGRSYNNNYGGNNNRYRKNNNNRNWDNNSNNRGPSRGGQDRDNGQNSGNYGQRDEVDGR